MCGVGRRVKLVIRTAGVDFVAIQSTVSSCDTSFVIVKVIR
jgi:hypothetical protein